MKSVGFIGIGAMGSAVASRLLRNDLLVNDRNSDAAASLVEQGARFASTDEIARSCENIFLCLPGPSQVLDLLSGPAGLAQRLTPGTTIIDITTGTPTADVEIAELLSDRRAAYVDAPIAGGVRRAREGNAVLMVGADPGVFQQVKDLLHTITSDVIHVGPVGSGHAMKLVNNLLNACNRFAALETIRLGVRAGIPQEVVVEVINKGSARNYTTETTYPLLLSGEHYKPQGFTLELMLKDTRLANEFGAALGHATPVGNLAQQLIDAAIERFGAQADQSQMMAEWYEHQKADAD